MGKFCRVVLESSSMGIDTLPDGTVRVENHCYITYTKDGEYHRTDGPAIINKRTGRVEWFLHGKRHRIDGPAIETIPFGYYKEYWVHGREFSKEDFEKHFGDE